MSYRLQLNKDFNFENVIALLDYFQKLGVEYLYLSPILQARKGSTHGYDVFDFSKISEELGGEEKFKELAKKAKEKGLKIILDIVPNHMALENPYLMDVLKKGKESKYFNFFDIEGDKIVLPILGEPLDDAINQGKLKIEEKGGEKFLDYYGLKLPLKGEGNDLKKLLEEQNYILTYWKDFTKINYRRFFDVNGLIALKEENKEVFDAVHSKIFELVKQGYVQALRVDHIDGLLKPKEYLEWLRERLGNSIRIYVEKILSSNEKLRKDWPIDGTTGYDFLRDVNLLFIDRNNKEVMEKIYEEFVGEKFDKRKAKIDVIRQLFEGDLIRVAKQVEKITGKDYSDVIEKFLPCMNVYRTYITEDEISWEDLEEIKEAAECSPEILELLNNPLSMMYIQQLEDPIMAKGYEDTFLYRDNTLISMNEVGSDLKFGISCEEFHIRNLEREIFWPKTMITTSTHDTKLSEDVRARLNVLSRIPKEWKEKVFYWHKINKKFKNHDNPTNNDEYRFYQVLLGSYTEFSKEYEDRIINYMIKAVREEKINTSWVEINEKYEKDLIFFIQNVMKSQEFLDSFIPFARKISKLGAINSVSQTILKLTSPGLPDIYQGNETLTYLLVDPDNRRKVDFDKLKKMLDSIINENPKILYDSIEDGRLKLYITWKILNLRRQNPDLFKGYKPITISGEKEENFCAFERNNMIVIVPLNPLDVYLGNTEIKIENKVKNIITEEEGNLKTLMESFPFGVFIKL
ncbi:malto-oligosyltrehalose synthase [Acidianus sulfidivorans JP7]|uniref:Malto-oligosyltrehalose synthase n=1 Tax=Acidianus sulfidivorans JP7 TaxID=619593 RepID=A0A2U9INA6_9CREN|nr:malto-oligosyltrehalose synthase [Acidianus sulfidivorans]AWR97487.1 malto-oligosyltrehalose synthase [Acidianus sulfidivorans JP7]